jgi:hypothetical protein
VSRPTAEWHVLIPGLLGPFNAAAVAAAPSRAGALLACLARAEREDWAGGDVIATTYHLFGLEAPAADIPSAALSWLGEGGDPNGGAWLHADPVLLKPDMDRLLLFDRRALDIQPQEADALVALINDHFSGDGWRLQLSATGAWYLRLAETPDLRTRTLYDVAGRSVYPFLPKGGQQRRWRAWLNELQMLLHQAEINQRRRARGLPEVSGLWLWGAGVLPACHGARWDQVCGSLPLLRGLAQCSGVAHRHDLETALARPPLGRSLLLLESLLYPVMDGDIQAWADNVAALSPWLSVWLGRLRDRSLDTLWIYPCNGSRYRLTAWLLWRFWRREKALNAWLDVPD